MANWFTRIFANEAPITRAVDNLPVVLRDQPRVATRGYQASVIDRLTASSNTTETTINQDIFQSIKVMRTRARAFHRDNEYGKRYISLMNTNVIGPTGFAFSAKVTQPDGTPDLADSKVVNNAFETWCKVGNCDVTGKNSFTQLLNQILASVIRDGEVMVRKVYGADKGPHHFQLQLLGGYLLNEAYNCNLQNGNIIRMGIEFDAWHKPVAYHLRQNVTDDIYGYTSSQTYDRIPASEIWHIFRSEEVDQFRGVPWASSVLRGAKMLDQFIESANVAANVGAAVMGFYSKPDNADIDPLATSRSSTGEFLTDIEPGIINVVPEGYEYNSYDPKYPSEVFASFIKTNLRAIATGLNVSYNSLANDVESVNYSSIRSGSIDERDGFMTVQNFLIDTFLLPLFSEWLVSAMRYDEQLKAIPFYRYDKLNKPHFSGRRFAWVDPAADMSANVMAVELGVKSRAEVILESGRDPDTVWTQIKSENSILQGWVLAPSVNTTTTPAPR